MEFKKQNLDNYLLHDTPVENLFISDYLTKAPGDYVKVFLLGLMCANIGENIDSGSMAKSLSLGVSTVNDAWEYWSEQGVVKITRNGSSAEPSIEFINIKDAAFGRSAGAKRPVADAAAKLDNARLSKLFRDVEQVTGRLLENKEPEAIASWLSNYEISPELIVFGYRHCTESKSSNRYKYVEAVVKDWKSRGFENEEDVREYLGETDRRYSIYRRIFRELGFSRNPSEPEKKLMDDWLDRDEFSVDEILDACKHTTGISNPNLNYINKVLHSRRSEAEGGSGETSEQKHSTRDEYYERVRRENERRTAEIREKIYTEIPRLRDIGDELKACGYRISKALLLGASGRDSLEREKQQQKKLGEERAELLKNGGYAQDALDMIYSCSKCKDTGIRDDGVACDCYIR